MIDVLKHIRPDWIYLCKSYLENNELSKTSFEDFYHSIHSGHQFIHKNNKEFYIPKDIDHQYKFIIRYFGIKWAIYHLFTRWLTFHSPIKHTYYFLKFIKTRRIKQPTISQQFAFEDPSISTTVILPTLNRSSALEKRLNELGNQSVSVNQIIIIDQSDEVNNKLKTRPNITYIHSKKRGQWQARNQGVVKATGDILLFLDDDCSIESDWAKNHIRVLTYFESSISCGLQKQPHKTLTTSIFKTSDEIDSGNFAIYKHDFFLIGLFDIKFDLQRRGDTDYAIRSIKKGFSLISNPLSIGIHEAYQSGGLRTYGGYTVFNPKNIFSPRPFPSNHYLYLKHFNYTPFTYDLLVQFPNSLGFGKGWIKKLTGWIVYVGILPLHLFNYWRSYQKGKQMYYDE